MENFGDNQNWRLCVVKIFIIFATMDTDLKDFDTLSLHDNEAPRCC